MVMDVTTCPIVWKINDDGYFMFSSVLVLFNEDHGTELCERNVNK
jgi:hypothetical protein